MRKHTCTRERSLNPCVYVSAKNHVEGLNDLLVSIRALVLSATLLAIQVSTSAALITSVMIARKVSGGLPKKCSREIIEKDDLSIVAATDELFWAAHPELKRRRIRRNEKKFAQKWWQYYRAIENCREQPSQ